MDDESRVDARCDARDGIATNRVSWEHLLVCMRVHKLRPGGIPQPQCRTAVLAERGMDGTGSCAATAKRIAAQ